MPNDRTLLSALIRRPLLTAFHAPGRSWVQRAGMSVSAPRGGRQETPADLTNVPRRIWAAVVRSCLSLRHHAPQLAALPPPLTLAQQRARWDDLRQSEWLTPLTPQMEDLLRQGTQILTADELGAINDALEAELDLNRFITLGW